MHHALTVSVNTTYDRGKSRDRSRGRAARISNLAKGVKWRYTLLHPGCDHVPDLEPPPCDQGRCIPF